MSKAAAPLVDAASGVASIVGGASIGGAALAGGVAAGGLAALGSLGWGLYSGINPGAISAGAAKADSFGLPSGGLNLGALSKMNLPSNSMGWRSGAAPVTSGPASPTTTVSASAMSGMGGQVVMDAQKYLGVPYQWGGTNPATGLDCSGLTSLVYKDIGIQLPRVSQDQAKVGTAVPSLQAAQPGDLVFYGGNGYSGTPSAPGHVGIYIGNGNMIDAPHPGAKVRIDPAGAPVAIRRIVSGNGNAATNTTSGASSRLSMGSGNTFGSLLGEGNGNQSESATLASAMLTSFSTPMTFQGHASPTNGGASGNTVSNGNVAAVGNVGNISSPQQWASALLGALGDPTTGANIGSLVNWAAREGGNWHNTAYYNPINTTQVMPGSTAMNKLGGGVGVQAYTSWQQGIQATVKTLQNGLYGDILAAFQTGQGLGTGYFPSLLKWSGGAYSSIPSYEAGTQYVARDQLAQLHRGEMVVRSAQASHMRANQMQAGNGPLINVEKGAVTFSIGSSTGPMGSVNPVGVTQQNAEEAADHFWNHVQKKLALTKVASE